MLLRLLIVFLATTSFYTQTNTNIPEGNRITYSHKAMQEHKKQCAQSMSSNTANLSDHTYCMPRALASLAGNDCDYIPKVREAGEIFYNTTPPYQLMHNGVKVILKSYYDSQWLTDVIFGLKGHHEPQEEKCFYEVLKYIPENATMIELGSYWAYYSLWFASEIKGAKNFLIEPDPKRLDIGKKNFELNGKQGIFKRGYVGEIQDADPDIQGAERISIDDFMDTHGITHVNNRPYA